MCRPLRAAAFVRGASGKVLGGWNGKEKGTMESTWIKYHSLPLILCLQFHTITLGAKWPAWDGRDPYFIRHEQS